MDEADKVVSRRQAVGMVGMGIATAAGGTAMAQQPGAPVNAPAQPAKDDPRSKYPRPPFQEQTQTWPGLAGKMNPKPDHGETSYRGSGRLAGRRALITGGDSGMGRAAAIAYAREGADVAINHLPSEEPDAREVIQLIKAAGRNGVSIPGIFVTGSSAGASWRRPFKNWVAWTSWYATPGGSNQRPPSSISATRISTRR